MPRPLHAGEEWGDEDCAEDWETTAGWFIGGDKDGTAICTSLGDDWFERPLQAGLPALIQRFLWSFWALISSPLSFWNLRLLAPQNGAHRLAQTEISIQPNPILSTYSSGAGKQDKTRWKCSFKITDTKLGQYEKYFKTFFAGQWESLEIVYINVWKHQH